MALNWMANSTVPRLILTAVSETVVCGIHNLALEARLSGHTFLDRLIADWHYGANCFDKPGEYFLGAYGGDALVACGGLNRDPYDADPTVGRLRHLYVHEACRRSGIGALLVRELIDRAATFRRLRLRTASSEAAAFYERLGFERIDETHATHAVEVPAWLRAHGS